MRDMATSRTVEVKARDGTMTLAGLREFVAAMDEAGAVETTPVSATVRFGGGIKTLKATAVRFGDPVRGTRG